MFAGDVGFRVFKLASSNIRAWDPEPSDLEGTLLANAEHLVAGRTEQDVLYELLLKLGLDLCVPIQTKEVAGKVVRSIGGGRSEEHTSELQSLMRISYAVFCLK